MEKLLDPTADPTFKRIMTDNSEDGRKALTSFVSAAIGHKVSDIHLLQNELPEESADDKQAVFDLTCLIDDKEFANVEMQCVNISDAFNNRAEYHVAHLLNHFVTKGLEWDKVPKVYQISVLNFIYSRTDSDVLSHYRMTSEHGDTLGDRLNVIFIELPKTCSLSDDPEQLTDIEKWSKFFANAAKDNRQDLIQKLAESEEGIMSASAILSRISRDFSEWDRQNKYYETISRENTIRSQGRAEGRVEGVAIGERNMAISNAKNFLRMGLSPEKVSEGTGLPLSEVKNLKY